MSALRDARQLVGSYCGEVRALAAVDIPSLEWKESIWADRCGRIDPAVMRGELLASDRFQCSCGPVFQSQYWLLSSPCQAAAEKGAGEGQPLQSGLRTGCSLGQSCCLRFGDNRCLNMRVPALRPVRLSVAGRGPQGYGVVYKALKQWGSVCAAAEM